MLGSVVDNGATIVADLEAGIGTLTRLADAAVDVTLVVVEPTPRSIDVARRAVTVSRDQQQGRIVVVANKVQGDDDRRRIIDAFADVPEIVVVPDDPAIVDADRLGVSPVDNGPSTAVTALEGLADRLT